MAHDVSESDWKIFRELREIALQRFCERVLEQVQSIVRDDSRSHHERYLAVFSFVQDRDTELASAFNNPARSRMILQLLAIRALGLLSSAELRRFSDTTRATSAPPEGRGPRT